MFPLEHLAKGLAYGNTVVHLFGGEYACRAPHLSLPLSRRGACPAERTLIELERGGLSFGPLKSDAGMRTVVFPDLISSVIRWHLSCFTADGDGHLIFTGPNRAPLRRGNFRRRVWLKALKAADLPSIQFHDLRHTGNNLTASAGASLRELMVRMGHSTTRAALIYLHSTDERQREIADALNQLARDRLRQAKGKAAGRAAGNRSGTQRARRRRNAS